MQVVGQFYIYTILHGKMKIKKVVIFVLGGMAIVTDLYSSLKGYREKRRTRGDYASYDKGMRYVSEPTETKIFKT